MQPRRKVGIVVVSYDAAHAVRTTLASLRAAHNDTPSELILVDNASHPGQREESRRALQRHVDEAALPWRHVQNETNLGFSAGNNVGLRLLLADPTITHFCLLNSDVIVTEHWLDRLLVHDRDAVSPVTNKAEGEQCVPVDYELELHDCFDADRDALHEGAARTIAAFAERRYRAFRGNLVDCDATFFCVVMSRAALERVGLLDEQFFPGGYEDEDWCLRARKLGTPVHLDRGVFVHHWGSASFSQLDSGYFNENAARNQAHLEHKHGVVRAHRAEKPLVSFAHDVAFALSRDGDGDRALQARLCRSYGRSLAKFVAHHRGEFRNLHRAIEGIDGVPDPVARSIAAATAHGDVKARWQALFDDVRELLEAHDTPAARREAALNGLNELAAAVHDVTSANFAMHTFLAAKAPATGGAPVVPQPIWRRAWSVIRHGVPFLLRLRGVVFFGGYPYPARESDGYFQRIGAIDRLFADRWRIYFDPAPLPRQTHWNEIPAPRVLVLRPARGLLRNAFVSLAVTLCVLRCRTVYYHSVLRMQDMGFGRYLRWPWLKKIVDVHGVVPEEFHMHDDARNAAVYDRHEARAARRAQTLIVVTEAMRRHIAQKHRDRVRGEIVVLPIFPDIACFRGEKPYVGGRPVVVYAGGLHKWQQVPKMIDAIVRTRLTVVHRFYCTDPEAVTKMLPAEVLDDRSVVVERKTHAELLQCYRECHYGLVLREDSIVNRVACPTKLVEYLAMGIVPIVDSEHVGDFVELGMRFVRLPDFVAGNLPDAATRDAMVRANFVVHGRLHAQSEAGATRLRQLLGSRLAPGSLTSRFLWNAGKLLPPSTRAGRLARRVWHGLRGKPAAAKPHVAPAELPPCDVLMQVGHFLAGGLENAVLDFSEAFRAAGLRVTLLVLGDAGPAVARARAQGIAVLVAPYSEAAYRHWLASGAPKVVMSHYCVEGSAVCAGLGIPLVQVIHNIYLWVRGADLAAMKASAAHTRVFVAVSRFAKDYSVRRLGVPDDKCVVIPYGIDVQSFRVLDAGDERRRLRSELGIGDDDFVFLNVGAINHQKNHLSQLRAFRACAETCPRARLVVVGPVYERELFRDCLNFVERHGLADRVTFTGGVSDPHRYYAMADALVHSAFFEGGPLALLEGLVANLPIVTVATGLAVHFAGRKGIATVAPHFDVASYEGHIMEMPSSAATEQEMSAAMRRTYATRERPDLPAAVIESFDRANTYRLYVDLVRELMNGSGAPFTATTQSWPARLEAAG